MPPLQIVSPYKPTGDQPRAIEQMVANIQAGVQKQTLLGATGTGKTFSISCVIERLQRPTLVLAHNKTLAAQLFAEFKELFPNNAVEYFVSYYDYYQPEAYVPRHDLYIEKQTQINEQIERLRLSTSASLLTRRDVIIVASVSCIYGIGDPNSWRQASVPIQVGDTIRRDRLLRDLVRIQYARNDMTLKRGCFRVRGDTLEIIPGYSEVAYRVALFGDEVERITEFDPLTGEILATHPQITIFPAREYISADENIRQAVLDIEQELEERLAVLRQENKLVEAQRLEQRVRYDIDMIREVGFTSGIENYSRHMEQRPPGSPPFTLLDYMPSDYLLVIDESHMTIPQLRGMYNGDRQRKQVLVDYGFRLPSALDNRPLRFEEIEDRIGTVIFTSATPGLYEREHSERVVEQIIRPTGILDPQIDVRPTTGQVDDLLQEVAARIKKGQRALVTTLTQRMAEEMAGYLNEMGIKAHYLHAEIDTIERVEILRDLRMGVYDVVVGINLLREGLDLPEVSLVAIMDADKEGFLRSDSALIQTIGRAARHVEGKVIMYADKITDSMKRAIDETVRRREVQEAYNRQHGIEPQQIVKQIRDLTDRVKALAMDGEDGVEAKPDASKLSADRLAKMIRDLEKEMKAAAQALEFEKAAALRDQIFELRGLLAERQGAEGNLLLT
ncbi:MAG: excinuclease ABC subunit UvrB [Anaerolineae bacterium]|nr:excinuclease ABC subunit UvrB [Anaerolineae bacterium]MDW8173058.1 excinuclease ABC subunit UvrB [Anaerolineae bacterium]